MTSPVSVGGVLALVVLLLAIVFAVLGRMDYATAGCLALLAVARLVP